MYVGCCSSNIDCYHMLIRASILKFCHILSSGIAELDFSVNHIHSSQYSIIQYVNAWISTVECTKIKFTMKLIQTCVLYQNNRRALLGKTFTFKHTSCIFRLYDLLTYNRKGYYKKTLCYYSKIINNKNLGLSGP